MKKKIPREPLDINYVSTGFLPDVAIHKKGKLYIQEPSHSYIIFCIIMIIISVCFLFSPIQTQPKYIIAGGILWAGLCTLIPYFIIRNKAQKICINKNEGILIITKAGIEKKIPLNDLVGLQIIYHNVPTTNDRFNISGYQLILVYHRNSKSYERHYLYKHKSHSFVKSLAKQYENLIGLKII